MLVAVLLVSQTALFVIMSRDRVASNETIDFYRISERAFWLTSLMAPVPAEERRRLTGEVADSTVVLNLSTSPRVISVASSIDRIAELENIIYSRLARFGIDDVRVSIEEPRSTVMIARSLDEPHEQPGEVEENLSEIASDFSRSPLYAVSLRFADGQWLNMVSPLTPTGPILAADSFPTYLAISFCVVIIAFWAVWRIAAPYQLLEAAVTRLGDDLNSPPLKETGSRDFRSAAHALNQTQSRLQEHFEERELLAAALAHDLRTPLTRMRLRIALLRNSSLKKSLSADIADIEETVESVIGLAKLNASAESVELIDLWSMADAIADEYVEAIMEPLQEDAPRLVCLAPPVALRRSIRNLVENAIKYGSTARISLGYDERRITLSVIDEGPGIGDAEIDKVFMPYVRLEQSRSRETGGSGLGLTIARNLIRKINGEISLQNRPDGGLEAKLIVPRAKA